MWHQVALWRCLVLWNAHFVLVMILQIYFLTLNDIKWILWLIKVIHSLILIGHKSHEIVLWSVTMTQWVFQMTTGWHVMNLVPFKVYLLTLGNFTDERSSIYPHNANYIHFFVCCNWVLLSLQCIKRMLLFIYLTEFSFFLSMKNSRARLYLQLSLK